jgi:hypothetical protein
VTRDEGEAAHAIGGLERRAFLRLAGLGVAIGVLPSGCAGVPSALEPPGGVRLASLAPRSYAVLTAAAMRIVGPAGAALVADRTIDVGVLADAWLARKPALAAPLGQALAVLEWAPWPLLPKLGRFTAADAATQDRVLADCMTSGLELKRALFRGIKAITLLTFYGARESRPLTGYPGPFGTDAVTIADAMHD